MSLETSNVVDGVVRYPPTGIQVVIVGAGLSGLLAALECWRKGHEVEVIEKSPKLSLLGDIVGIGPHAWVTLREYPKMFEEWNNIAGDPEHYVCRQDGTLALPKGEFEWNMEGVARHAIWPVRAKALLFRQDLAGMYLAQCKRLGISVRFGVNAVEYHDHGVEGTATVTAEDGQEFLGDVIIAADGLGTKSHAVVLGYPTRAVTTGYCADRVAYPTSIIKDSPALEKVATEVKRPQLRMYNGHRCHAVLAVTRDRIAVSVTHEDDGTAEESWSSMATPEQVAEGLPDHKAWDPILVEAIKNSPPNAAVRWKLCWRDPQPKWTSATGHIVQVGDAAHSLLPTSVNGAAMALEDSISLAECLRLGGKEGVRVATKVHEKLRYERTSLVQLAGFVNRRQLHNTTMDEVSEGGKQPFWYGKWLWQHNAERYATANFDAARANLEAGQPFSNTNLPPGHKVEHWTMASELEKEKAGIFVQDLKTNGEWTLF